MSASWKITGEYATVEPDPFGNRSVSYEIMPAFESTFWGEFEGVAASTVSEESRRRDDRRASARHLNDGDRYHHAPVSTPDVTVTLKGRGSWGRGGGKTEQCGL